ncbi:MAG: hypothetical protein KAI66_26915, partial [Lentisphaeria bacterium]|nr:hypothetical protein [Lentisphaeria bacterium]
CVEPRLSRHDHDHDHLALPENHGDRGDDGGHCLHCTEHILADPGATPERYLCPHCAREFLAVLPTARSSSEIPEERSASTRSFTRRVLCIILIPGSDSANRGPLSQCPCFCELRKLCSSAELWWPCVNLGVSVSHDSCQGWNGSPSLA